MSHHHHHHESEREREREIQREIRQEERVLERVEAELLGGADFVGSQPQSHHHHHHESERERERERELEYERQRERELEREMQYQRQREEEIERERQLQREAQAAFEAQAIAAAQWQAAQQQYQSSQPVYQPPEPVYQPPPQPVYQPPPQPVYQAPLQPVYQPPPQPVYQAPPAPVQSFAPPAGRDYAGDAQRLRNAMKGWFTDDAPLIDIIGNLGENDIRPLIAAYRNTVQRDLIEDVKSDTHRDFHDCLLALLQPPTEYDARTVHDAVKGLITHDMPIIEVICTRSFAEMQELAAEYKRLVEHELEDDIRDNIKGELQKLLLHRIRAQEEKGNIDEDVEHLYKAGQGKLFGHDDAVFINILAHRSKDYLLRLNAAYASKHGKSLNAVIESNMSGDLRKAFIAIVTPPPEYFSERLREAIEGLTTDTTTVMRIIASQRYRNLKAIAQDYQARYHRTLKQSIESDTHGDLKKILSAVIFNIVEGRVVTRNM